MRFAELATAGQAGYVIPRHAKFVAVQATNALRLKYHTWTIAVPGSFHDQIVGIYPAAQCDG